MLSAPDSQGVDTILRGHHPGYITFQTSPWNPGPGYVTFHTPLRIHIILVKLFSHSTDTCMKWKTKDAVSLRIHDSAWKFETQHSTANGAKMYERNIWKSMLSDVAPNGEGLGLINLSQSVQDPTPFSVSSGRACFTYVHMLRFLKIKNTGCHILLCLWLQKFIFPPSSVTSG